MSVSDKNVLGWRHRTPGIFGFIVSAILCAFISVRCSKKERHASDEFKSEIEESELEIHPMDRASNDSAEVIVEPEDINIPVPQMEIVAVKTTEVIETSGKRFPSKPTLIKLFFATSRKALSNPSNDESKHPRYFGSDWMGGQGLAYGTSSITMPTDKELPPGEIEGSTWKWGRIRIDRPDNRREDVWMHRPKMFTSSNEFFSAFSEDIKRRNHNRAIIGVHGFNNSFEFAGRRLAKMMHDMNYHGTPVLYSWPAGDGIDSYTDDEQRVSHSFEEQQFTEFLLRTATTARAAGVESIDIVAHSMGNRLLVDAASRLSQLGTQENIFDNIVLAAPDIAKEDFSTTAWPQIKNMTVNCALYVSAFDKALFGSAIVHPKIGLRLGDARDGGLLIEGLQTIDASETKDSFLHHDHHLRLSGICDLSAMLIRNLSPNERVNAGLLKTAPGSQDALRAYFLVPNLSVDCTPN